MDPFYFGHYVVWFPLVPPSVLTVCTGQPVIYCSWGRTISVSYSPLIVLLLESLLMLSQIAVELKHQKSATRWFAPQHCTIENLFAFRHKLIKGAGQTGGFKLTAKLISAWALCSLPCFDEIFSWPVWTVRADPVGLKVLIPTGSASTKY